MKILGHEFYPMTSFDWNCFAGADEGSLVHHLDNGDVLIWSPRNTTLHEIQIDAEGSVAERKWVADEVNTEPEAIPSPMTPILERASLRRDSPMYEEYDQKFEQWLNDIIHREPEFKFTDFIMPAGKFSRMPLYDLYDSGCTAEEAIKELKKG